MKVQKIYLAMLVIFYTFNCFCMDTTLTEKEQECMLWTQRYNKTLLLAAFYEINQELRKVITERNYHPQDPRVDVCMSSYAINFYKILTQQKEPIPYSLDVIKRAFFKDQINKLIK